MIRGHDNLSTSSQQLIHMHIIFLSFHNPIICFFFSLETINFIFPISGNQVIIIMSTKITSSTRSTSYHFNCNGSLLPHNLRRIENLKNIDQPRLFLKLSTKYGIYNYRYDFLIISLPLQKCRIFRSNLSWSQYRAMSISGNFQPKASSSNSSDPSSSSW